MTASTGATARSSLVIYILRRLLMLSAFAEQHARALAQERQLQAEAENRVRRLLAVRRWERKAEKANLQLRLARLSVR
jgi:hypothetical protein